MPPRFIALASAISFIAATVITPVNVKGSQEVAEFKAGETVFVIVNSTELMVGHKTLRLFSAGSALKVISVLDAWVQVEVETNGKSEVGWVRLANVSRTKPAEEKAGAGPDEQTTTEKPKDEPSVSPGVKSKVEPIVKPIVKPIGKPTTEATSDGVAKEGAAQPISAVPGDPPTASSKKQASEPAQEKASEEPKSDSADTASKGPAKPTKPASGKGAAKLAKPATTEKADQSGTSTQPDESEIGEGPERLAEKFSQILAGKRGEVPTLETPRKDVQKKTETEPPKQIVEPIVPEVIQPATIGILVLRIADDLVDVKPSERIEQLILSGDQFTNRSLRGLAGLSVSSLSIEAINVSNAGIQYVKDVRGIRTLRLWSPGIDDGALKLVAQLSDLQVLDLEGTAISGTEFPMLLDLPKLESLVLGPKVSDATIANLENLPALRQLDLRACKKLTLDCLKPLATLKDLTVIWLPRHLRTKGRRILKSTLPECQVRS